jgi:hypothetical protein
LSIYAPWFALYKSSVGAQILIATDFLSNLRWGYVVTLSMNVPVFTKEAGFPGQPGLYADSQV